MRCQLHALHGLSFWITSSSTWKDCGQKKTWNWLKSSETAITDKVSRCHVMCTSPRQLWHRPSNVSRQLRVAARPQSPIEQPLGPLVLWFFNPSHCLMMMWHLKTRPGSQDRTLAHLQAQQLPVESDTSTQAQNFLRSYHARTQAAHMIIIHLRNILRLDKLWNNNPTLETLNWQPAYDSALIVTKAMTDHSVSG